MNASDFEAQLRAEGYSEIETKTLAPRPANVDHGHDFSVCGLVLSGAFTVAQEDGPVTYRPGDVFTVEAGKAHSEEVGPEGARILAGRKYA